MSSSAPAAMPSATRETDRATSAGAGTRTIARSTHASPAIGSQVHVGRDLDPSARTCWLPVPRSPLTCQVSSTTTCSRGSDREPHAGRATGRVDVQAVEPHPGRVLHAGDEAPPPGHPEPVGPDGLEQSRSGLIAPATIAPGSANSSSKVARGRCTMSNHGTRPDHHRPPDGGIGAGQGLDRVQLVGQRPLDTAVAARQEHPEAAGARQLRHEVGRQPTCGLGLRGPGGHLREPGRSIAARSASAESGTCFVMVSLMGSPRVSSCWSAGGWVGGSGWRRGRRRMGRLGGMPRAERLVPVPAAEDGHLGDLSGAHGADVQPAGGEQPTVRHGLGREVLGEEAVLGGRGPDDGDLGTVGDVALEPGGERRPAPGSGTTRTAGGRPGRSRT